jgi:hypothetical protein
MPYVENPLSLGKVQEGSIVKLHKRLFKVACGFNARIELLRPTRGDIRRLRDELSKSRDKSQNDWRRWNEIDYYYTIMCIAGV